MIRVSKRHYDEYEEEKGGREARYVRVRKGGI